MVSRRLTVPLAYPRREAGPRSVTRIDHRSLILVLGLLALAAFAGVLYLSQASVAAELRYRLVDTEAMAEDLWQRNLALRQNIADLCRLDAVEERALRLGMVDAPAGEPYIACTLPQTNTALADQPAPVDAASSGGEIVASLWELLAGRLGWLPAPDEVATGGDPLTVARGQ